MKSNLNPCFTPANEPYLGRESLYNFDQVILSCLQANTELLSYNKKVTKNRIQKVATQIIPPGISIALSIRELVRQGYLFGAVILMRPLIERAAIISYLCDNPKEIDKWEAGWKYGKRPSLLKMLTKMGSQTDISGAKVVCETFNHIVHGDPEGATFDLIKNKEGELGYSISKSLNNPDLCDFICLQSYLYLIILMARMAECFPSKN